MTPAQRAKSLLTSGLTARKNEDGSYSAMSTGAVLPWSGATAEIAIKNATSKLQHIQSGARHA